MSVKFRILPLFLLFALLLSCSSNNGRLVVKGSFKGINQGELYIYGMDGTYPLDTIALTKGEFQYQIPLQDSITFVLVFPNFSELPVFGEPGAEIMIEGDATHLKETKITGTKTNEELTAFRLKTSGQTPPEMARSAAEFIKEHPQSPSSIYLLNRYFIQSAEPNYHQAYNLANAILRANPGNQRMTEVTRWLTGLKGLKNRQRLLSFTATDINGKTVSSSDLNAKINVIAVWSTWNYESRNILRQLQQMRSWQNRDIKVLGICVDADIKECKRLATRDSLAWTTICDGKMWETPILQKTGLSYVPDNIITDKQGNILGHSLNYGDLRKKIDDQFQE